MEPTLRTTGRHVIVGKLVGFDDLACEATVRTDQGKKIVCTHLTNALLDDLAPCVRKTVCLVGFGTWGNNGGLVDFRPVQVLGFDEDAGDPGAVQASPASDSREAQG